MDKVDTCIVFSSVQHKLLEELLSRLAARQVQIKRVDCTYAAKGSFARLWAVFCIFLRVMKEGILSGKNDLLVFHYLSTQVFLAIPILILLRKKIVLHFWGSDYAKFSVLKPSLILRLIMGEIYAITFANNTAFDEFRRAYPLNNARKLTFGLEVIDFIDEALACGCGQEKNELPIVVCGTNSSPNQQLLEIIDVLDAWEGRTNFKFIFPLAYGDDGYKKRVITRLIDSSLIYEVNEKFMVEKELALFRLNADILIQVQKTDFLSGAMLEHGYAGTKIITGSWLPYDQLRQAGIKWFEVKNISELPAAIDAAAGATMDAAVNRKIIGAIAKWGTVLPEWERLYGRGCEK